MQLESVTLLAAAITAVSLIAIAIVLFYVMLGEVNGRSRPEDRIGYLFVRGRGTEFEVIRRHRALFPESKLRFAMITTLTGGMLWMVLMAIGAAVLNG